MVDERFPLVFHAIDVGDVDVFSGTEAVKRTRDGRESIWAMQVSGWVNAGEDDVQKLEVDEIPERIRTFAGHGVVVVCQMGMPRMPVSCIEKSCAVLDSVKNVCLVVFNVKNARENADLFNRQRG